MTLELPATATLAAAEAVNPGDYVFVHDRFHPVTNAWVDRGGNANLAYEYRDRHFDHPSTRAVILPASSLVLAILAQT